MRRTTTTMRGDRPRRGVLARAGLTAGLLATIAGGTLIGAAATLVGPGVAGAAAPARIVITQTPISSVAACTSAAGALSYEVWSDASIFRLRIRAAAPLCTPVTATAAIYAMPKDGTLWPQTLSETQAFTISAASITDVVFDKDCTPSQFDVVTGATPQVIAPFGEHHGPLLFPDTNTAYQDPGILCEPVTSTSTTPTTVTSTTAATSTTVANSIVANTTTTTTAVVVAGNSATPTTQRTSVLGISDPTGSGDSGSPAGLAVTGVSSQRTALLGTVFLCVGMGLILATRRRALPAVRMITSTSSVNPVSPFSID